MLRPIKIRLSERKREDIMEDSGNTKPYDLTPENINEALKKIAEEYKDKYLRTLADFENFKKKKNEEVERIRKTAAKEIILQLLPSLDDCETAYTMTDDPVGIELIYSKIFNVLKSYGVEGFGVVGEEFDADYHNAIQLSSDGKVANGCISEVFKTGYKLNGEIIRHADVIVEQRES